MRFFFILRIFSGRFDTSGSRDRGGVLYPKRDGGEEEEEEGQGWGNSMSLMFDCNSI